MLPIAKKAKEKVKVNDLGADFRLKDAAVYEEWYKVRRSGNFLEEAVYGLNGTATQSRMQQSSRIQLFCDKHPLGLMPLMKKGWVVPNSTSSGDFQTGTSGAGRAGNVANLFTEVENSFKAYG